MIYHHLIVYLADKSEVQVMLVSDTPVTEDSVESLLVKQFGQPVQHFEFVPMPESSAIIHVEGGTEILPWPTADESHQALTLLREIQEAVLRPNLLHQKLFQRVEALLARFTPYEASSTGS